MLYMKEKQQYNKKQKESNIRNKTEDPLNKLAYHGVFIESKNRLS